MTLGPHFRFAFHLLAIGEEAPPPSACVAGVLAKAGAPESPKPRVVADLGGGLSIELAPWIADAVAALRGVAWFCVAKPSGEARWVDLSSGAVRQDPPDGWGESGAGEGPGAVLVPGRYVMTIEEVQP